MEENRKARIGFIGCGNFSTGNLYPTIPTIPEIDLVAVCDLKEELAKRNARNFGAKRWYTDLEKMLSEEQLDGVAIVGLPKMHYEIGKRCLDAGLPIYVEKPSANTYKEALELAEYAKNRGLFGIVGFMKRHSTCYRMAKAITEKEEFGTINEIEVRFANGRYPNLNKLGWGLPVESPSYSFLIGQAVHILDLVRFFCGEVKEIYASLNDVEGTDEWGIFGYAITVTFRNGTVGTINLNATQCPDFQMSEYFFAAGNECWLEVRDMMELNYHPRKKPMSEFNPEGRAQIFSWKPEFTEIGASTAGGLIGYKGEMQNFAKSLLGLEEPVADLFDGAKALQIAEGIWESAQSKKVIKL